MPKRRRSSWGCVQAVRPGVWRIRYTRDGRRASETFEGTRREADDRLAALRVEFGGSGPASGALTMGQAYARFVEPREARALEAGALTPNTLKWHRSTWRAHVAPRWADVPVRDVRPLDVQAWLLTKTPSVAGKCLTVAGDVFEQCRLYEVVDRANPFSIAYEMPRGKPARAARGWNLEGLGALWSALYGSPVEAAFILMAFGSCRVGESLGVRSREVGLRDVSGVAVACTPILRQSGADPGKVSDRLKNAWSARTVVVPGKVALRLHSLAQAGGEWLTPSGGADGLPMCQSQLRALWAELVPDRRGRTPRDLRSSWETFMHWELGVAPEHIEKMMGHVGAGVTGRHYDRPDADVFASVLASAYAARPYAEAWFPER